MSHFKLAITGLVRHRRVAEIAGDIKRAKKNGYTGVWLENDYIGITPQDEGEFPGNWKLFNIFDFTFSKHRRHYRAYLQEICDLCAKQGLDVYLSFWMPKLSPELLQYLRAKNPAAVGRTISLTREEFPSLCSCEAGGGLEFLGKMVERFMTDFPVVKGLKVSTEDNHALLCSENCPNAHGTTRAEHAGNMFATVQRAMKRARPDSQLLMYPWFWGEGYFEAITSRLTDDYLIVTKMESGALQPLDTSSPREPLFDSSLVADQPGPAFLRWVKLIGSERIIDMVPVGTGIDDFFLANPPYPGRLYRRFQHLRKHGVKRFLDFECSGHWTGSGEEAVELFNQQPALSEKSFLTKLSRRIYRQPKAGEQALAGWRAFDQGFGKLPIGLATGANIFSGRIGFSWSMCIATPLLQEAIGEDREHGLHFFSPYNFFSPKAAPLLGVHFSNVLGDWLDSSRFLACAHALEGSVISGYEAIAAEAHVLSMQSVLHWCAAAQIKSPVVFHDLMKSELALTRKFYAFTQKHPWVWGNNCWHPHQTPLSQKKIAPNLLKFDNAFEGKIAVMEKRLKRKP